MQYQIKMRISLMNPSLAQGPTCQRETGQVGQEQMTGGWQGRIMEV